jgi:UDP-N-acetylglucosamine--N-acetylmuramyl-(pentapeptide) pyrophosphoryl-undecaprenol N-acetylglucosamine transferase
VTGVPVRQAFFEIQPRAVLNPGTLLVFGGSQGAHSINQALIESVPKLRAELPDLHIIHQTGDRDYNDAAGAYAAFGDSVHAFRFIDDMPAFFARADLIICRSGASTVAEIAAAGKPAIFIPFPRAADDHQKRNAELLERAGAAVMLEESDLTSASLVQAIVSLMKDADRIHNMGRVARTLAHPDAAKNIAKMAANLAGIK